MGILDYLIPQTMEMQRARARQQFQAGMQQPQIFQTEEYPLQQLAASYEKGFGMPYPRQPAASPTAAIEGMTTDPNRGTTIQPPANLPLELIKPRSLEESTLRQAGIEGRGGAEKDLSSLQYYGENMPRLEGFFEDVGENPEEYDLPASIGGFQRPQPTEAGKSYGDPYWDERVKALLQKETDSGKVSEIAGAPGEGGGSGSGELDKMYDDALNTYKAIVAKAKLDPTTALMLQMMPDMAKNKEFMEGYVTPKLTPAELQQLQQAVQIMDHIQKQRRSGFGLGQLPMEKDQQDAATAESFLKKHIGQ